MKLRANPQRRTDSSSLHPLCAIYRATSDHHLSIIKVCSKAAAGLRAGNGFVFFCTHADRWSQRRTNHWRHRGNPLDFYSISLPTFRVPSFHLKWLPPAYPFIIIFFFFSSRLSIRVRSIVVHLACAVRVGACYPSIIDGLSCFYFFFSLCSGCKNLSRSHLFFIFKSVHKSANFISFYRRWKYCNFLCE